MMNISTIEGQLQAKGLRFALVASRFNDFVVDKLISGAIDYLIRHGADSDNLSLIRVPGSFDMPVVVKKTILQNKFDGFVCLGAVIRGATPHFDYVAAEVSKGLANMSIEHTVPIGFGILTTDTLEQAIERAGSKAGNKGADAAQAALETAQVLKNLDGLK
ncbi:MAG TPA: 6,7-dimethyl-8-ribityllumazine synthase [Desulfohalobiaceae bacterium]|nr:6,7-dimethyl-8-ribityllumazine synthase [Desulfohalobiaceae bacterium]